MILAIVWSKGNILIVIFLTEFFFCKANVSVKQFHSSLQSKYLICLSFQALDINKKLNCCTMVLSESFDQIKTVASKKEGLLYGVPVSIKENVAYKVLWNPIPATGVCQPLVCW